MELVLHWFLTNREGTYVSRVRMQKHGFWYLSRGPVSDSCAQPFSFPPFERRLLSTVNNQRNDNLCFISISVRAENQHRKKISKAVFAHKLPFLHWIVSVSVHGYLSYIFHCHAIPTPLFHCSLMPALVTRSTFTWACTPFTSLRILWFIICAFVCLVIISWYCKVIQA